MTLLPKLIQRIQCLCKIFSGLVKFTQVHWLGKECHTTIVTNMFAETTNFAFVLLHLLNGTYRQQILQWRLWLGLTQVHPKTLQLAEWLSLKQKLETCCGQVIVWYWKCDCDNPTWVKETLLCLQWYILYICVCVCVCVRVCASCWTRSCLCMYTQNNVY